MAINNFKGYRYRRYAVALWLALAGWVAFCVSTWLINPGDWLTILVSVGLLFANGIPLTLLALHCQNTARDAFATQHEPRAILGVVLPKESSR
jgi:hypothetical protein